MEIPGGKTSIIYPMSLTIQIVCNKTQMMSEQMIGWEPSGLSSLERFDSLNGDQTGRQQLP